MKVNIGPYCNWIGPYQIAEKLCFWAKKVPDEIGIMRHPEWVDNFGEFLAHGFHKETEEDKKRMFSRERPKTWLYKLCEWIYSKQKRKISIKLDRYDHWNAFHTMSLIILPLLKELREHKHGSGMIDDEDVPEGLGLRSTEAPPKKNEWDTDANLHKRYEWVLDEIIWAHEQIVDDDWEAQYCKGEHDLLSVPCEFDDNGKPKMYELVKGPNNTFEIDMEGRQKHQDRIDRGLRLFGKYYCTLWD